MANKPKKFYRGIAPAAPTVVYTTPAGATAIVTNVVVANNTVEPAVIAIQLDGVSIAHGVTVSGNSVFTMDIAQVLESGGELLVQSVSDGATVAMHICGVEVS